MPEQNSNTPNKGRSNPGRTRGPRRRPATPKASAEAVVVPEQKVLPEQASPQLVEELLQQSRNTAGQPKQSGQPKQTGQPKQSGQPKQTGQPKQSGQPKQTGQPKQSGQQKQTRQPKQTRQQKQPGQQEQQANRQPAQAQQQKQAQQPKAQPDQAPGQKPEQQGKKQTQGNNRRNAPKTAQGSQPRKGAQQPVQGGKPQDNRAPEKKTAARKPAQQAAATEPGVVEKKAPTRSNNRRRGKKTAPKPTVRMIPLGGLGEVGKNITVYECQNDSFLVDCGLTFPDEGMPGVDLVIPDFTYVEENKDRIQGIVITHGHEDHIGSLPYLLKKVNLPLYGTRLTLALVEGKLKEHGLLGKVKLNVMKPGDIVNFGCMSVEFINVNHSIPDAVAFGIQTPAGCIVQTGDFKIDFTPIRGDVINLARFGELGSKGVLALLSDSTNAERPGSTMSERTVGESFDKLFAQYTKKRILVATFASNVHRLQQIIDAAVKYGRKVAVSGRSMENVVARALEIGYLDIPAGVLVEIDMVNRFPPDKMVIVTTGSQGEPMSALTRMAMGDHRKVSVSPTDCIIISASPIPGNEKLVTRVINELLKLGADVVYEKMFDIHVSGHACQDELKMMMAMTKPKFFVPMHGEFKHLKKHAELARSMGIAAENTFIGANGLVLETDGETMKWGGTVPSGKVMVDGLGVGDVGSIVLRDRKHLAQDGLIVVVTAIEVESGQILAGPDIVSRGFVYVRESEDMIDKARNIARQCIQRCIDNNTREWGVIKQRIKDDVGDYLWHATKRNPMILPVIQEV